MSAWKLVEAVAEESPAKAPQESQAGRGSSGVQCKCPFGFCCETSVEFALGLRSYYDT